ncbi:hypothetical protein GCM10010185_36540 [Saccharothrix coeruleofusca]|uniref:Lipoprotein n=1 Tax=Saccharothrix coeruleofusca TaxID=33919 RepID=A0A918EEY5_9PSEU|nr:hypothetical protein [Saccharothrix coeruleofusca]GGP60762.1 hypothetical protein GCM10010185_36540 [Saccharothrix coeruleofusca]
MRHALLVAGLALVAAVAGCSTPPARSAEQVKLTIKGQPVLDAQALQAQAESELSYALNFGLVARAGRTASCWFARTGAESEVDTRLWCGPVQVPGTAAAGDWVPVPMKEVERSEAGVRLVVEPAQVPEQGSRSTPVGKLVRTDGLEADPAKEGVSQAGPDFLAVLPDDGRPLDPVPDAWIRDDQLEVRVTGYGRPESWRTEQGDLTAEHGVRLRVLRLEVDKHTETDPAFGQSQWHGWQPQRPELALELPGRHHPLPGDRLPASGSVLVVYTVPESGGTEALSLATVGAKSLEQRVEVPSGKALTDIPPALRRAHSPERPPTARQQVRVGDKTGSLGVSGLRLGRQRPVSYGAQYELVTASQPDRALLELRLEGRDLPRVAGAAITQDLVAVTLPDGQRAPLVGARYDGDTFPVAVVVEVPADTRSVTVGVTGATVALPQLGTVPVAGEGSPVAVPLDF